MNKIRRAKQFVSDHHDAFMWTSGLLTGGAVVFGAMYSGHSTDILRLTVEQAKGLMEERNSVVIYELPKQTIAVLVTD